jgi:hypothetical protein
MLASKPCEQNAIEIRIHIFPNLATGGCLFARTYARFVPKLGVVDDVHPPPERFAELDPQIVE